MYFKPRIFVSSAMRNNAEIRCKINKLIESLGAECLLYEQNLTPSTLNKTYRYDIMEADFVILIIDDEYGSCTDMGISGTEEEFNIAIENNLKLHVYIKDVDGGNTIDSKQKAFKEKIENKAISYYYYKNDEDLLNRIQSSICTIVKEIVINNISHEKIDMNTLLKISFDHDYKLAMGFIILYKEMMELIDNENNPLDYMTTNVMMEYNDNAYSYLKTNQNVFLDQKLYDCVFHCYSLAHEFIERQSNDITFNREIRHEYSKIYKEITIMSSNDSINKNSEDWYKQKFTEYKNSFEKLITYIEKRKTMVDMKTF